MPEKSFKDMLLEGGWSQDEIKKTAQLFDGKEELEKTSIVQKKNTALIFWVVLIAMVFGNFIISLVLIPVLMALQPGQVDVVIIILGLAMGLVFNHVIWNFEGVDEKHHFFAMLFIPVIALLNMGVVVVIANLLSTALNIPKTEDPVVKGIFYMIGFVAPYASTIIKNQIYKRYPLKQKEPEEGAEAEETEGVGITEKNKEESESESIAKKYGFDIEKYLPK